MNNTIKNNSVLSAKTVKSNPFCLGTAQFGLDYGVSNNEGKISSFKVKQILEYGIQNGINTLDTAVLYGDSESVLGNIGVKNWQIVSKLPAISEEGVNIDQWVEGEVIKSLQRLQTNSLYGLLLHRPDQLFLSKGKRIVEALQGIKEKGLVRKIGVSVYSVEQLNALLSILQADIVQIPFNIFDQRFLSSGMIEYLKQNNIEIHARSIFLQGLLLMSPQNRPVYFNKWDSLLSRWDSYLRSENLSALEACIRFVIDKSMIDKVIVGVQNQKQLEEILHVQEFISKRITFPDYLESDDQELINPSNWKL